MAAISINPSTFQQFIQKADQLYRNCQEFQILSWKEVITGHIQTNEALQSALLTRYKTYCTTFSPEADSTLERTQKASNDILHILVQSKKNFVTIQEQFSTVVAKTQTMFRNCILQGQSEIDALKKQLPTSNDAARIENEINEIAKYIDECDIKCSELTQEEESLDTTIFSFSESFLGLQATLLKTLPKTGSFYAEVLAINSKPVDPDNKNRALA